MVRSETSSVVFLNEDEGVDTDEFLVSVPSVPLTLLGEGNLAIVD